MTVNRLFLLAMLLVLLSMGAARRKAKRRDKQDMNADPRPTGNRLDTLLESDTHARDRPESNLMGLENGSNDSQQTHSNDPDTGSTSKSLTNEADGSINAAKEESGTETADNKSAKEKSNAGKQHTQSAGEKTDIGRPKTLAKEERHTGSVHTRFAKKRDTGTHQKLAKGHPYTRNIKQNSLKDENGTRMFYPNSERQNDLNDNSNRKTLTRKKNVRNTTTISSVKENGENVTGEQSKESVVSSSTHGNSLPVNGFQNLYEEYFPQDISNILRIGALDISDASGDLRPSQHVFPLLDSNSWHFPQSMGTTPTQMPSTNESAAQNPSLMSWANNKKGQRRGSRHGDSSINTSERLTNDALDEREHEVGGECETICFEGDDRCLDVCSEPYFSSQYPQPTNSTATEDVLGVINEDDAPDYQSGTEPTRSDVTTSFWQVGRWLSSLPGERSPWTISPAFYSSRDEQIMSLAEALVLHAMWFHNCWVTPLYEVSCDSLEDELVKNRYFGSALLEEAEWVRDFCKWACYQLSSPVNDDTCSISAIETIGIMLENQNFWAEKIYTWAKSELGDIEGADAYTITILEKLAEIAYFQGRWIQCIYGWLVIRLAQSEEPVRSLMKGATPSEEEFEKTERLIFTFGELLNSKKSEMHMDGNEDIVSGSNRLGADIAAYAAKQKEFLEKLSKNINPSDSVSKKDTSKAEQESSEHATVKDPKRKKRRSRKKTKSHKDIANNTESNSAELQSGRCDVPPEHYVPVHIRRHTRDPIMQEIEDLYTDVKSVKEDAKSSDAGDCAEMLVVEVLGVSFNPQVVRHAVCDERAAACMAPSRCAPQLEELWLVRPIDTPLPDFPHQVVRTRLVCQPPGPPSLAVRIRITTACRCV